MRDGGYVDETKAPTAISARAQSKFYIFSLTVLLRLFLGFNPPVLPFAQDHDGDGYHGGCAARTVINNTGH